MEFPSEPSIPGRVADGLARLGLALRHRAWRDAGSRGLTPTQGQVLAFLQAHPQARISAVAADLAVTLATMSDAVRTLERKGLVQRAPCAEDGRAILLRLTRQGRAEAGRVAGWSRFLRAAAEDLTEAEQETLLWALVAMIRSLQRRGEIPVARMCVSCRYFRPHAHRSTRKPHHCTLVDAAFGDGQLRIDCPDQQALDPADADLVWGLLMEGRSSN